MSDVFARMGTQRKSFDDYAAAADARDVNALALKTGGLQYQNALQATQDEAAYRDIAKGFGPDTTANYNALLKASPKHAQAYQKAVLDAEKDRADIGLKGAQTGKAQADAQKVDLDNFKTQTGLKLHILQNSTNPDDVVSWLTKAVEGKKMTLDEAKRSLVGMPQGPDWGDWRRTQLALGIGEEKRQEMERGAAEAAERARHNRTTEGLTASGQRQQLTIAQMNDARQRELNANTKADREEAKKLERNDKEVTKYSATLQKEGIPELENAVSGAEAVLSKYKKGEVPGIGPIKNALPAGLMSDEGKDTRQALAQVRNIVLSARSGAAVTDQELRRLVEEIGTGVGMSEDDIRRGLGRIRDRLEIIKANSAAGVSDEVKKTYEDRGGVKIERGGAKKPAAASGDPVAEALKKYGG